MAVVLDSSVATQIVLGSADGRAMQSFIMEGEEVFAPDLLQIECANGFWKYVHANKLSVAQANEYYQDAIGLVSRYVRQNDLMDEVLATAAKLDHSVYDIIYLVLARRMVATLMTLDRKLIELCKREGVDCVEPIELSDGPGAQEQCSH